MKVPRKHLQGNQRKSPLQPTVYVQQQIQRPFQENFRWHQQHFLRWRGNASTAFPASLLSASAKLSNHFFKVPLSFDAGPPAPPLPPKTPVIAGQLLK